MNETEGGNITGGMDSDGTRGRDRMGSGTFDEGWRTTGPYPSNVWNLRLIFF